MSNTTPFNIIERWLQDTDWKLAECLVITLGIKALSKVESIEALRLWLYQSRKPPEILGAVLSIRAFIDFDCARFGSASYQDWIDANFQYAADAGSLPMKNRMAINEVSGTRQQSRQDGHNVAASWQAVRPTDQSILEWWLDQMPGAPPKP